MGTHSCPDASMLSHSELSPAKRGCALPCTLDERMRPSTPMRKHEVREAGGSMRLQYLAAIADMKHRRTAYAVQLGHSICSPLFADRLRSYRQPRRSLGWLSFMRSSATNAAYSGFLARHCITASRPSFSATATPRCRSLRNNRKTTHGTTSSGMHSPCHGCPAGPCGLIDFPIGCSSRLLSPRSLLASRLCRRANVFISRHFTLHRPSSHRNCPGETRVRTPFNCNERMPASMPRAHKREVRERSQSVKYTSCQSIHTRSNHMKICTTVPFVHFEPKDDHAQMQACFVSATRACGRTARLNRVDLDLRSMPASNLNA